MMCDKIATFAFVYCLQQVSPEHRKMLQNRNISQWVLIFQIISSIFSHLFSFFCVFSVFFLFSLSFFSFLSLFFLSFPLCNPFSLFLSSIHSVFSSVSINLLLLFLIVAPDFPPKNPAAVRHHLIFFHQQKPLNFFQLYKNA